MWLLGANSGLSQDVTLAQNRNANLKFKVNGTDRMIITPIGDLTVKDGSETSLFFDTSARSLKVYDDISDFTSTLRPSSLIFDGTSSLRRMTLSSSSLVFRDINTDAQSLLAKDSLYFIGTGSNEAKMAIGSTDLIFSDESSAETLYEIGIAGNSYHKWYIGDAEKLTLDSNGVLGSKATIAQIVIKGDEALVTKEYLDTKLRPYTLYVATVSQSGTSAPIANVLENDLGFTPVWSRSGTGVYHLTETSAFDATKVIVTVRNNLGVGTLGYAYHTKAIVQSNFIEVTLYDNSDTLTDAIMSNMNIEIKIYP
jgi:hypothetical protein